MNVIILTPDRVGSTLLQRLITVYANINESYNPLTINLHELTNGLVQYENQYLDKQILGKKTDHWGYHQSLETVARLISECDHDVVSRLAYYHIKNRRDKIEDQIAFYKFINENFYVIAARRQNLFEHALSWAIAVESKRLNVYSAQEKHDIYKDILEQGICVQNDRIEKYLNDYQEYMEWVDNHFKVNAYFEYERDLADIENFVLGLGVFRKFENPLKWHEKFDITWADWNRMHYLLSLVPFDYAFSIEEKDFMSKHIDLYTACRVHLQDLQDQGILVSGIPIKLHTLHEKSKMITNVDQCLVSYNKWATQSSVPYAVTYTPGYLTQTSILEHTSWTHGNDRAVLTASDIPTQKLLHSDLKFDN